MHKYSSSFFLGRVEEIYDIVEATLDVLTCMILQIETAVLYTFLNVVIGAVRGGAVDDVGDAVIFEFVVVLSDYVWS